MPTIGGAAELGFCNDEVWFHPCGRPRVMEPERAWVGPSLVGMCAYRTVRSGLSAKYGVGERKKFGQCLLIYLRHAANIHRNCANPLCLLQFSGSKVVAAVKIYPAVKSGTGEPD